MSKNETVMGGVRVLDRSTELTPDGWQGDEASAANKTVPLSDWQPSDGHRYAWAINKLAKLWNGRPWFAEHVKPRREA